MLDAGKIAIHLLQIVDAAVAAAVTVAADVAVAGSTIFDFSASND